MTAELQSLCSGGGGQSIRGGLQKLGGTVLGGQGWCRVGGLCGGSVDNRGTVVCTDVLSNPHFYLFLSL